MATSAPTWSRPHRLTDDRSKIRTGIYRQIVENWEHMCALPSMANQLRKWAAAYPVLKGTTSLPDLLDRIDEAAEEETDQIFIALISLAQEGRQIPAQVLLQAMLPKLSKMSYSANTSGTDACSDQDRRHIGVATFLEVVASYPVERRTRRVAANLSLDTLHRLTASTRTAGEEIPGDMSTHDRVAELGDMPTTGDFGAALIDTHEPVAMSEPAHSDDPTADQVAAAIGDCPNPDGSLLEVVAWGIDAQAISSEDAALLVRVYAPAMGEEGGHASVAAELGLKPETVRQRCSRATRALASAVRAHADGSWVDSPAAFA